MLWKECMSADFHKCICSEENFLYLNRKNVIYSKIAGIVWKFIQADEENCSKLRNNLCQFKALFQYVYANVYPQVYCSAERRGLDLKWIFELVFKT